MGIRKVNGIFVNDLEYETLGGDVIHKSKTNVQLEVSKLREELNQTSLSDEDKKCLLELKEEINKVLGE